MLTLFQRYSLTNSKGVCVKILDYGGIITHILVPDKHGKTGDVTLGFDNMAGEHTFKISWCIFQEIQFLVHWEVNRIASILVGDTAASWITSPLPQSKSNKIESFPKKMSILHDHFLQYWLINYSISLCFLQENSIQQNDSMISLKYVKNAEISLSAR